jgi:hypothetical protein
MKLLGVDTKNPLSAWRKDGGSSNGAAPEHPVDAPPEGHIATPVPSRYGSVGRRLFAYTLLLCVGVVAYRGGQEIIFPQDDEAGAAAVLAAAQLQWPDERAKAFAQEFTRTYYTRPAKYTVEDANAAMVNFFTEDIANNIEREPPVEPKKKSKAQYVYGTAVSEVVRYGASRSLIVVQATVGGPKGVRVKHLGVPVVRDNRGGLSVFSYPSVAPGPPVAQSTGEGISPRGATRIDDEGLREAVDRFFDAWYKGDRVQLSYLTTPDSRIASVAQDYKFVESRDIFTAEDGAAFRQPKPPYRTTILVKILVGERSTKALVELQYRMVVSLTDRWRVVAIDASPAPSAPAPVPPTQQGGKEG